MCCFIGITVNSWVSFLNVVLWIVNSVLCVIWRGFCFCAQYIFMIYRLESELFLCTVHISGEPSGKCSVSVQSTHFWFLTIWYNFKQSISRSGFLFLALRHCDITVLQTVPVPVETCHRSSFPYECNTNYSSSIRLRVLLQIQLPFPAQHKLYHKYLLRM